MTQFLIIARDRPDASERRLALREQHLAIANRMVASGNLLYGVAMLGEDGRPNGSVEVVQFETRVELDPWLKQEPFVVGQVWDKVEVIPCRVGPMFAAAPSRS